jgi:hypothetical protein
MDRDAIRSYVERRWDLVEREKIRARAQRYKAGGPDAMLESARHLRDTWLRLHPEADPKLRERDYRDHLALKMKLQAIADALARR